jgi:phage/plasmid-associated DNA primase
MTGVERLKVRELYARPFVIRNTFKFFIEANFLPEADVTDSAFFDRVKRIPFHHRFEGDDRLTKDQAVNMLLAEAEGILRWIVDGAIRYFAEGHLHEPEIVTRAINDYQMEGDSIQTFISTTPEKKRDFQVRLTQLGYPTVKGHGNVAYVHGLARKDDGSVGPTPSPFG